MRGRLFWLRSGLWLLAAMELQLVLVQLGGGLPLLPLILVCALGTGGRRGLEAGLLTGLLWDGLFYASGCSMTLSLAAAGALAGQVGRLGLKSRYLEYLLAVLPGILLCETARVIQGAGGIQAAAWEGLVSLLLAVPGYWLCPR